MSQYSPTGLAEGAVFHGRYQIVRCLAAGGMGAVYECIHLTTQKHRALKVMLRQVLAASGMRERFELEARVTARSQCYPQICRKTHFFLRRARAFSVLGMRVRPRPPRRPARL